MLKIRPEHLEHMRAAMAPFDTPTRRARYVAGDFPRAESTRDLDARYRWDLLHDAGLTPWVCSTLYEYLNDAHIHAALRHLIEPLPPQAYTVEIVETVRYTVRVLAVDDDTASDEALTTFLARGANAFFSVVVERDVSQVTRHTNPPAPSTMPTTDSEPQE